MKDYRLDQKADPDYIVSVKEKKSTQDAKNTTLEVKFADGRKFKNIIANDVNISKIIEQQELQAKAGVENIDVFKNKRTRDGIATGLVLLVGGAGTINMNSHTFVIATGVITLLTALPFAYSLVRNSRKVKELHKIKYRDEHRDELESFSGYENALAGLSTRKQKWFKDMMKKHEDPFSITEIDSYSKHDLETITKNINTEKNYQFTYKPRQTQPDKK